MYIRHTEVYHLKSAVVKIIAQPRSGGLYAYRVCRQSVQEATRIFIFRHRIYGTPAVFVDEIELIVNIDIDLTC